MNIKLSLSILLFIIMIFCPRQPYAFKVAVHERITANAIQFNVSNLTGYLNNVGFVSGIGEKINGKEVWQWITYGSKQEDEPFWSLRYTYHFYNPLDGAGLKGLKSSYEWANDDGTSLLGNSWSWRIARDKFYTGLTAARLADRQVALADSFRAVGQMLHLVQDLASPAHVRNDAHPLGNSFENYTLAKVNELNYSPVTISIPTTSVSPYAPRQFWDTDKYDGYSQLSGTDIGLAEYTNSNFFSEDSITSPEFPYPSKSLSKYYQCVDTAPPSSWVSKRQYLSRTPCPTEPQQGSVDHFLAWSFLPSLQPGVLSPAMSMDDSVNRDYANQLIPRAVGYSAGLLNYFFRGKLAVSPVDDNNVKVYNFSNEPLNSGIIELYYDDTSDQRHWCGSLSLQSPVAPGKDTGPITLVPMPPTDNKRPGRYLAVFKGTLGSEEGAVIGSFGFAWREEWDNDLKGNHTWLYSDTDLVNQNPQNPPIGSVSNVVAGGKLIKDNIRWTGQDWFHVNQTLIKEAYINPATAPNLYCANETSYYCFPYDFGKGFPIPMTSGTQISLKINSMTLKDGNDKDITIPNQLCGHEFFPTASFQHIMFSFRLGDGTDRSLEFTSAGHESYLWPDSRIPIRVPLGQDYSANVFNLLSSLGSAVEPVILVGISISQQLLDLCELSTTEHRQHMEIDYIRVIDGPVQPTP